MKRNPEYILITDEELTLESFELLNEGHLQLLGFKLGQRLILLKVCRTLPVSNPMYVGLSARLHILSILQLLCTYMCHASSVHDIICFEYQFSDAFVFKLPVLRLPAPPRRSHPTIEQPDTRPDHSN